MLIIQIAVGIFMITTVLFALMGIVRSHEVWYIVTYGLGFGTLFGLTALIIGILTFQPKKKQAFDMESAEEYQKKKEERERERLEAERIGKARSNTT